MTSVFFIHLVANNGPGTCTNGPAYNGTFYAALFINDGASAGTYHTTNNCTLGGFTPFAVFFAALSVSEEIASELLAVELVDEVLCVMIFFSCLEAEGSAFFCSVATVESLFVVLTSDLVLQAPNKTAALKIKKLCFMDFL